MDQPLHVNLADSIVVVHRSITRGLDVSCRNSRAYAGGTGDGSSRQGFLDYLQSLATVLHTHHLMEDELTFPYFRQILPELPTEALIAQHQQIEGLLGEIRSLVQLAMASPEIAEPWSRIGAALTQLIEMWHPHIGIEETHITPEMVTRLVSPDEHARLGLEIGRLNQEHLVPAELVLAFVLHNLEPDDRALLAAAMPPIISLQLIPVTWRARWQPMDPYLLP
jgi:hypothetical protein